jgi:hypothetical protein
MLPLYAARILGLRAEPEAQQEVWRQQRHMLASGAIDLHKVALPEVLDYLRLNL